jgi:thymidylate synthase
MYDLPTEDLEYYRQEIKPSLPWADRHFEEERVSGHPLNPGETWKIWPYSRSANTHRREGQEDPQFDHSYAERYWPVFAGMTRGGKLEGTENEAIANVGYRFPYGDLNTLVKILAHEPTTRQAYLPIWFPEDLAAAEQGKRVPCTLGYHLIMRDKNLHIVYPMRSCDYIRHFRDDVYLTVRLLLWVLDRCRKENSAEWFGVKPGTLTMHITSLHAFVSDKRVITSQVAK